ncbi:MAG: glutamate 5-kinase [Planctomycetota bacterium]|jgi:glutamate 5-kinase
MSEGDRREAVHQAKRVVIKVGTRVITHDHGGLALTRLFRVVEAAADLRRNGREVLIVSSGAVGLGRASLGLERPPRSLNFHQACAAIGQSRLMALYEHGFQRLGLTAAQVLLTQHDMADRARYLNLRGALEALLHHGVVPIINENDVVATGDEYGDGVFHPVFGDNDGLSALVATKLGAHLLVLLTDVEGVYDGDPRTQPEAGLLRTIASAEDLSAIEVGGPSAAGRGGMQAKIAAARLAARGGCHAVIASGRDLGAIAGVLAGKPVGTWFPAEEGMGAQKRWLAFASERKGVLHIDDGAAQALLRRGASLLAAGVEKVEGGFAAGEVVELRGPDGVVLGRGIVSVDAESARRWSEGEAPEGVRSHHALVHRDRLVLGEEAL